MNGEVKSDERWRKSGDRVKERMKAVARAAAAVSWSSEKGDEAGGVRSSER